MKSIINTYPVKDEEYKVLEDNFEDLVHYQGWQLLKKNSQNNHTEEEEDIAQELRLAMIRAGSYHKRQVYIQTCLATARKHISGGMIDELLTQLEDLWQNRKRHGAHRQKFGPHQEQMLMKIVKKHVPKAERPDPAAPLKMDETFSTYCKAITWNAQKSIGKKITKEKSWRSGLASISEFDYLAQM